MWAALWLPGLPSGLAGEIRIQELRLISAGGRWQWMEMPVARFGNVRNRVPEQTP